MIWPWDSTYAETATLTHMASAKPHPRDADSINSRLLEIRHQVRAMIEVGTLKPGERINEQALAAQLGVGRTSAREALRSLERTGLVRIVPNRGAEVRKVTLEEALDLYDLRSGIASVAGRLAAARLGPEEERDLQTLMARMGQALQARDTVAYSELNARFHRVLMAATKNARLIEANDGIENELMLYLRDGVYTIAQMHASHEEHRRMMEAVCNGRLREAAEAFEAHITNGKQRMLDTRANSPTTT